MNQPDYLRSVYEGLLALPEFAGFKHGFDRIVDVVDLYNGNFKKFQLLSKKSGVSIIGEGIGGRQNVKVKVRTHGAAYRNLASVTLWHAEQVNETIQKCLEAASYTPKDPGKLPEPYTFSDATFTVEHRSGWYNGPKLPTLRVRGVFGSIRVMGVAAIGEDWKLDFAGITEPDQECWYVLDCTGHSGATFNVITDGEVFYPITRITQNKPSARIATTSGKATVDLQDASAIDKEMVNKAIEVWTENLTRNTI
jgi:hypothetical protein